MRYRVKYWEGKKIVAKEIESDVVTINTTGVLMFQQRETSRLPGIGIGYRMVSAILPWISVEELASKESSKSSKKSLEYKDMGGGC